MSLDGLRNFQRRRFLRARGTCQSMQRASRASSTWTMRRRTATIAPPRRRSCSGSTAGPADPASSDVGPWRLDEKMKLWRNEGTWNRRSGLLFIDQPIGVGFSIAESAAEIPTDERILAAHLFYALQIFLQSNPMFMKRPIFVAGESYAGKYAPALAYFMLSHNNSRLGKFSQFAGMAIGNGLTDPRTQILQAADTVFYLGLLDEAQTLVVRNFARQLVALIDQGRWAEATSKNLELVMYIYKASGVASLLDIRRNRRYHHREDGVEFLAPFLNSSVTRAALKVDRASNSWQSNRPLVKKLLGPDVMKSAKWMVEAVLKAGYPVLLYQGVYDAKDGPACNEAWMRLIDWEHIKRFWACERELWRVNRRLAGYWRHWKNLSHVVVHGAGHLVHYHTTSGCNIIEISVQDSMRSLHAKCNPGAIFLAIEDYIFPLFLSFLLLGSLQIWGQVKMCSLEVI